MGLFGKNKYESPFDNYGEREAMKLAVGRSLASPRFLSESGEVFMLSLFIAASIITSDIRSWVIGFGILFLTVVIWSIVVRPLCIKKCKGVCFLINSLFVALIVTLLAVFDITASHLFALIPGFTCLSYSNAMSRSAHVTEPGAELTETSPSAEAATMADGSLHAKPSFSLWEDCYRLVLICFVIQAMSVLFADFLDIEKPYFTLITSGFLLAVYAKFASTLSKSPTYFSNRLAYNENVLNIPVKSRKLVVDFASYRLSFIVGVSLIVIIVLLLSDVVNPALGIDLMFLTPLIMVLLALAVYFAFTSKPMKKTPLTIVIAEISMMLILLDMMFVMTPSGIKLIYYVIAIILFDLFIVSFVLSYNRRAVFAIRNAYIIGVPTFLVTTGLIIMAMYVPLIVLF